MSIDQNQRQYLCLPDKKDSRDYKYNAPRRVRLSVPYEVDTFLGLNLAPYDQGSLGSCVSNATSMAYRFARIKQKLSPWMPSRLFHY